MNNSIRDKWCEKEISDLDYIRHLEAENAKLKEPNTCETCKHKYIVSYDCTECRSDDSTVDYLDLECSPTFGCTFYEPKEQQ